jgi:hypothetical protein
MAGYCIGCGSAKYSPHKPECVRYVPEFTALEARLIGVLRNIESNDMRSHFNRVDAITLSQWAREALEDLK